MTTGQGGNSATAGQGGSGGGSSTTGQGGSGGGSSTTGQGGSGGGSSTTGQGGGTGSSDVTAKITGDTFQINCKADVAGTETMLKGITDVTYTNEGTTAQTALVTETSITFEVGGKSLNVKFKVDPIDSGPIPPKGDPKGNVVKDYSHYKKTIVGALPDNKELCSYCPQLNPGASSTKAVTFTWNVSGQTISDTRKADVACVNVF